MSNTRTKGTIASWNENKGYGFIMPDDGGKRIFAHITDFSNRNHQPKAKHVVTYNTSTDKQGRPCATSISKTGVNIENSSKYNKNSKYYISVFIFLCLVLSSTLFGKTPFILFGAYLGASLLTFIIYAMDKSSARRGAWRTPENTLHLFALLGGWPGAMVAQQMFRHKSQKQPFRTIFGLTVITNIGAFVWFHTLAGANTLNALLSHVL